MGNKAVVFSADGSKCGFEVGVIKALEELNLNVVGVSASFIGALNATLFVQGKLDKTVNFWRSYSILNINEINEDVAKRYTQEYSKLSTLEFRNAYLRYIINSEGKIGLLKQTMKKYIDEDVVRKSDVKLCFLSMDIKTFKPHIVTIEDIPKGKLIEHLLIAVCFPIIAIDSIQRDRTFTTEVSPYLCFNELNIDEVLSTEENITLPPMFDCDVKVIKSLCMLENDLQGDMDIYKKNMKRGYINTYRSLSNTAGSSYFIVNENDNDKCVELVDKLGSRFGSYLDELVDFLVEDIEVDEICAQLVSEDEAKSINIKDKLEKVLMDFSMKTTSTTADYLRIIENLAKSMDISKEQVYSPNLLLSTILDELKVKSKAISISTMDKDFLQEALNSVNKPGKNLLVGDSFVLSFLLFVSLNPKNYDKVSGYARALNQQTICSLIVLLYLIY